MASSPISGERVFTPRIMAGVAGVALSIASLVAVKVVELLLSTAWQRSTVSVMGVKAVVNVAIKAAWTVKPGTCSEEYSADKPIGAVVSIWSAVVRFVVEVPIGAHRSYSDIDSNLRPPHGCTA
jgi:uncharacterized membrane protein